MRRIHRYLIDHRNRLLPVANAKHVDAIPVEWSNFTRQAVESETKSKAVEAGMREWCERGHETKELYAKSAKDLYGAGEVAAAHMICELVRDVDDECEYADRSALSLSAVDYDMRVIVPMRHSWVYSITICRASKPSARKSTTPSCRRSTRYGSNYLSNSVNCLSHA